MKNNVDVTVTLVINVDLLKKQRNTLLKLSETSSGETEENVEGLINLIEAIMDKAEGY